MTAKILLLDIETAPNLSYVWGKWKQNVIEVDRHWYILSFSVKWLREKKIQTHCLPDYKTFRKDKEDDSELCRALWQYLDEADLVIAHNGDKFDLRKINARFIAHRLSPPKIYRSIDTLKIARKHFKFDSNRLDDLGAYLGVGRKLPHTGPHLWLGCMKGDAAAWKLMRRYNAQDIALLERVYLRLRPYATSHPNLTHISRKPGACPVCESAKLIRNGRRSLRTGYRQQFQCIACGHQFVGGPIMRYEETLGVL